jgi:hypothetical protein
MALQLRDKSNFIPKLTPIAYVFKLNLFNTYSLSSQSIGAFIQIQTLGHPSPKLEPSMACQNQAAQVNLIPVRFIRHYPFRFLLQISSTVFSWQELSTELLIRTETNSTSYFLGPVGTFDPANSLQPNPKESLSRRLYQDLPCGKMLSRTGLCPQLPAGEIGIKGYLQITAPRPTTGTASASLNAWSYLWPRPQRMRIF